MSYVAQQHDLSLIDCTKSWNQLSDEEKMYVHYLNEAVWSGFPISVKQTSIEAYEIFVGIIRMFKAISLEELMKKAEVSEEAKKHFENYVVAFLANGGNYLSFGDIKFVPGCTKEEFVKIVSVCGKNHFESVIDLMYDETPRLLHFGLAPEGCTAYYSENMTKEEIEKIDAIILKRGMMVENTRIDKIDDKYIVGVFSLEEKEEEFEGITFKYGLCKEEMKGVIDALQVVLKMPFVQNDETKRKMFENYIAAFTSDYVKHKDSQKWWTYDIKPTVEFNGGFTEVYEDPVGVRGEWEMLVGIVDKDKTRRLTELVNRSDEILPSLPWGKDFEKDKFESPDFTSIDIVSFGTSGIPIGINLPNYGDLRMDKFKNLSLSNVMSNRQPTKDILFVNQENQEIYKRCVGKSLELQVALHELLGHGSGKYFRCDNGVKNYPENLINPLTGKPVTCYKDNETFENVFKQLGMPMEECRAEATGLFLSYNDVVSQILEIDDDVKYINWLSEMRSGMISTKFYNPETKKWGQAHSQARYALYKTVEKCGAVRIEGENIVLDREKIPQAVEAVGELLKKLQICRATGDVEYLTEFFVPLSTPTEEDLKFRDLVISKKIPPSGLVQCNTKLVDGKVELITYDKTPAGIIQSYLDRYDF